MRKKACDVLFTLYRLNAGQARFRFEQLIHEDSQKALREQLVDNIWDEFDRMDGKPTKKEAEAAKKREVETRRDRKRQKLRNFRKNSPKPRR